MTIGLHTRAFMALTVASLSVGCCHKRDKPVPKIIKTTKNKPDNNLPEKQDVTTDPSHKGKKNVTDVNKPNRPEPSIPDLGITEEIENIIEPIPYKAYLSYMTTKQPYAHYHWSITDTNNEQLEFYGQNSNEVTITDLPKTNTGTYQINITCAIELNKQIATTTKTFSIDLIDIERLEVQKTANKARASWMTNAVGKRNKVIKAHVAEMKLGEEAAEDCFELIKAFTETNENYSHCILKRNMMNLLTKEPIKDKEFEQKYQHKDLGYATLYTLEQLLNKEVGRFMADVLVLLNANMNLRNDDSYGALKRLMLVVDVVTPEREKVFEKFLLALEKYVGHHKNDIDTSIFSSRINEWHKEIDNYGALSNTDYFMTVLYALTELLQLNQEK